MLGILLKLAIGALIALESDRLFEEVRKHLERRELDREQVSEKKTRNEGTTIPGIRALQERGRYW